MYQLLSSAGKDEHSNICAKGLSGGGYEGHYFWDTEIYMVPFFMLTKPEIAKSLLRFRYVFWMEPENVHLIWDTQRVRRYHGALLAVVSVHHTF